jgi:indole-3-pyruvate monooxygenase
VESVYYDKNASKWCIVVRNNKLNTTEVYIAKFLVVATGENSEGLIPKVPGLDGFEGMYMHSSQYANGKDFNGKDVLVVGCGNSGMEIAYDLLYWGAHTSIVARSPVKSLHLSSSLEPFFTFPFQLIYISYSKCML